MNPLQEGGRYQAFEQPLLVNGVRLLGYYNEARSLKSVGNLLFWGGVLPRVSPMKWLQRSNICQKGSSHGEPFCSITLPVSYPD
ncbi:hypothetical protein ACXM5X_01575 [Pseudomonas saponiphila]